MKQRSVFIPEISTDAITSDTTVIYTVPPNTRAKWLLAFLSNTSGSTVGDIALFIYDGVQMPILGSKSLGSGDFIQFESAGGYVMLEEGDELRARSGTAGVSCLLTLEETTGLVRTN